ncbi:unnamed protein product [Clonostachys chloroleuca]|uniref:DEAD/DEAH box helicase n=1 Tax=Clonostachys chloroleuca TaxID=1926264 RepID=A0AA35QDX9_9HYPO|nr:unnamed protein product [Clonostachys chloroleuca]
MDSVGKKALVSLKTWYAHLRPNTVDIVGDFAGKELFLIHGESLLRHCLDEVDFHDNFQLLHAVWAVEDFLSKLCKRGCNFDIIFFSNTELLCAPNACRPRDRYKYQLARTLLIQHLKNIFSVVFDGTRHVYEYNDMNDPGFEKYIKTHTVHFVLCHEGVDEDDEDTISLRLLIYQFIRSHKNVAIINSVEFRSSKAFFPMISGTTSRTPNLKLKIKVEEAYELEESIFERLPDKIDRLPAEHGNFTLRMAISVATCQALRGNAEDNREEVDERISAFMLHLAILHVCSLLDRQIESHPPNSPDDVDFLRSFCETAHLMVLKRHTIYDNCEANGSLWDLYDLLDGRVFFHVLARLRRKEPFPENILTLAGALLQLVLDKETSPLDHLPTASTTTEIDISQHKQPETSVLEFSHPALDDFLSDINLKIAPETRDPTSDVVFEDLTHWHNARKRLVLPRIPSRVGFFGRKRQQKMMADMTAYSASLTNAQGKSLEPEIIIAASKKPKPSNNRKNNNNSVPQSSGKKASGGRASALKAAAECRELKTLKKQKDEARYWDRECSVYEKDPDLVSRYWKALKFAQSKSSGEGTKALVSEVDVYMCNVLCKIWSMEGGSRNSASTHHRGYYIIAMLWNCMRKCSNNQSLTPEVADALTRLNKHLKMPSLPFPFSTPSRSLPFRFDLEALRAMKELQVDAQALQLEYAGPYMDRRFDSRPDDRVQFEPDAWQRQVLDSIDEDDSLIVVAPTSAGKTFISFYAMKKILESDDDSVIVYVAPTKALVNQIAAEINARFSKDYSKSKVSAKSVWAIHTRDYRVNTPTECQILVTVPQMLQIMLLSPSNATGPRAWSKRVKRIIFDEVHCIGQNEDGVVWEQLLLLAPCPIIALSATIGNPGEFQDWLQATQVKKGRKMKLVVHNVRYSDLRKFIYKPSKDFTFQGLRKIRKLPVPGLDEGPQLCQNLKFIHPIAALIDRNRGALGDLSLEARDCFILWTELGKTLSNDDMRKYEIDGPAKALPTVITKSDVRKWEESLKSRLLHLIQQDPSAFERLKSKLGQALEVEPSMQDPVTISSEPMNHKEALFELACDLHQQDALPALAFSYDRTECEKQVQHVVKKLEEAENVWKESSPEWRRTMDRYQAWQRGNEKRSGNESKKTKASQKTKNKDGDADKLSKMDIVQSEASVELSPWECFDPDGPLDQFSFADKLKLQLSELNEHLGKLKDENLKRWMMEALRRGVGVHHAGINRRYRQIVEILFRKGYLRLVIATGTLALGINMPCKTVVFSGDSIFLTAQNYRQASGRAGRRGFDLLGNVVFNGIPKERVYEIMSSRLPDLRGQFCISTSLILRLFGLLHGTNNGDVAVDSMNALLSQTRIFAGGPEAKGAVKHHLRFSIDYLRRHHLLSATGAPLNFAGLIGHLYFTENSVFAFHSLLKGGYFHNLCARIDINREEVLLELMLVLSHLFNRIPVKRSDAFVESLHRSSSVVFLPRLPASAEKLLLEHNAETLRIFRGYVSSYISHNLANQPDCTLPFSGRAVGAANTPRQPVFAPGKPPATIRSPFVALSGFDDTFKSIHDLCSTVRGGVFLEESAIPYIPVWPRETATEHNAYLYDFYKHASMSVLVRDNRIKDGDVWFLLKDFSLTLAAIVSSLEGLAGSQAGDDGEDGKQQGFGEHEFGENEAEAREISREEATQLRVKKPKAAPKDSWDDSDEEEGDELKTASSAPTIWNNRDADAPAWQRDGQGLANVLKAFVCLHEDFTEKFKREWA